MHTVNKPDFFIVGAPKCGTTALHTYLAGHPDIGMSRDKELGFLASSAPMQLKRAVTLEQYLDNFKHAT